MAMCTDVIGTCKKFVKCEINEKERQEIHKLLYFRGEKKLHAISSVFLLNKYITSCNYKFVCFVY